MWDLYFRHTESSFLTRDLTQASALGTQSLSHWTTKEVLVAVLFKYFDKLHQ